MKLRATHDMPHAVKATHALPIDFIGIGPSKAGTTWVGHMIDAHPSLCMAEPKEVHFFNDSLSANGTYKRSHYPLGFEWYARHWNHARPDQKIGEITPRYFFDPVVPRRIFDHNPDIRLIVCLRDPIERIVSHYHHIRDFHHAEPLGISEAIRRDPEYIENSLVYKQVSRYLEYFRLDQFHFVEMDQIRDQPENVVRQLYAFLQVDPGFVPAHIRQRSNPARGSRSRWFRNATTYGHRAIVSAGGASWIRLMKKAGIGQWINRINSKPIEKAMLTEEDKQFIRDTIREDVHQLSILLGKDFSRWLK